MGASAGRWSSVIVIETNIGANDVVTDADDMEPSIRIDAPVPVEQERKSCSRVKSRSPVHLKDLFPSEAQKPQLHQDIIDYDSRPDIGKHKATQDQPQRVAANSQSRPDGSRPVGSNPSHPASSTALKQRV